MNKFLMQFRQPHLALSTKERKFARKLGWNLNTCPQRLSHQWYVYRPNGTTCGFLYGYSEIRRARTLSFIK
jgi:hypothetical protein